MFYSLFVAANLKLEKETYKTPKANAFNVSKFLNIRLNEHAELAALLEFFLFATIVLK